MPVAFRHAGRIHASRRRQGQEVLHGDDDRFGPAAAGIGDEGADDFLRSRFIRQAQHLADVELLARRQVVFIPAADGVVVMGPGIGDAVRFRIEGQAAVGPVLEVELDDFHPRQVQGIFQGAHVVGNDAQVFGDEAEPADFLIDRPEKVEAGALFPGAALSRFRAGRHRPVGGKAAEMVDPDFVDEVHHAAEAVRPPLVVVRSHGLVIVKGIAPELAIGTEVIGRDAGDR